MAFNRPKPKTQGIGPAGMNQPTFAMEFPRVNELIRPKYGGMGRQLPSSGPVGGPLPPTGRTLGGEFVRIGDLPGAKPPPYMMDTIHDVLGIGDRRKERYLAETQGGHPNMSEYGYNMQEGLGSLEAPYREEAAVDPSDWRNILRILEAGGDPGTETAGIMGALPEERQMAGLTQTWQKIKDRLGEAAANDWLASQQAV